MSEKHWLDRDEVRKLLEVLTKDAVNPILEQREFIFPVSRGCVAMVRFEGHPHQGAIDGLLQMLEKIKPHFAEEPDESDRLTGKSITKLILGALDKHGATHPAENV